MSRILHFTILLAAIAIFSMSIGCQSTGGGGYTGGSDGHAGHNH